MNSFADNEAMPQINYIMNANISSQDYTDVNGHVPKEGLVSTPDMAFRIAELVLNNIYGKQKIDAEKPFSINLENDIWVIEGHLEAEYLGGVAYIEIRKSNGEILKVIHSK
jgi:hypothetical protein